MIDEILMTRSAVARALEASEGSVDAWAKSGRLACIMTTTKRRLYRKVDVDLFKEQRAKRRGLSEGPRPAA